MSPSARSGSRLPLEDPRLDAILSQLTSIDAPDAQLLPRIGAMRRDGVGGTTRRLPGPADPPEDDLPFDDLIGSVLAWAAPYRDPGSFVEAVRDRRAALAHLRRDDAALTLATAHSTKGLEFDHVAVVDMDDGRFPSQRTLDDADDPGRALEEERRLAYVAWTRARRSLTLVYDPAAPSTFLREAFSPEELSAARST